MTDDLRARIAEALADVRLSLGPNAIRLARAGEVLPLSLGERMQLTDTLAELIAPLEAARDRLAARVAELEGVIEQAARDRLDEPVLRRCVYPGCLSEFDLNASASASGREPRPSWSGDGWLQVNVLSGYICPEHAPVVADDAHRPAWLHGPGASTLACACGWSTAARWRGYGIEAWKDHVLPVAAPAAGAGTEEER